MRLSKLAKILDKGLGRMRLSRSAKKPLAGAVASDVRVKKN